MIPFIHISNTGRRIRVGLQITFIIHTDICYENSNDDGVDFQCISMSCYHSRKGAVYSNPLFHYIHIKLSWIIWATYAFSSNVMVYTQPLSLHNNINTLLQISSVYEIVCYSCPVFIEHTHIDMMLSWIGHIHTHHHSIHLRSFRSWVHIFGHFSTYLEFRLHQIVCSWCKSKFYYDTMQRLARFTSFQIIFSSPNI